MNFRFSILDSRFSGERARPACGHDASRIVQNGAGNAATSVPDQSDQSDQSDLPDPSDQSAPPAPPAPKIPGWLHALYPFTPRSFITPHGARMSYLDEGPANTSSATTVPSAEAVLMLHGNPTWSFFYRDVVRALAPSMRCIAPDHIGMGLSEKPPASRYPHTLAARIADIEALVSSLGLKRAHLVVHDWGGAIGLGLATRRPELIGRIVILNTAAFPDARIPSRIALCRAPLGIGTLLVRGLNGFAWPATWMAMRRRKLTPAEKRGYLHPYDSWRARAAIHEFVRDIPMSPAHRSRATLAEIERKLPLLAASPKLILWGGRDFCFNNHFYNRWRSIYPDAAACHFPDAGHYILDDTGGEALDKITGFLAAPKT